MFIATIILGAVALALAALCVVSQRRHEAATANLNYQLDDLNARIAKLQGENAALMAEKSSLDAALQQVQLNLQRERVATERLTSEKSELLSQTAALRERVALNESEREKREQAANDRFRNLANEIFSAHTASFRLSSEQRIQEILDPLKANIDDFRKAVTTAYSDEAKERFSLQNELRNLMELNKSIGKEAQELTRALKGDSKVQGDWGEMILERMQGCAFPHSGDNQYRWHKTNLGGWSRPTSRCCGVLSRRPLRGYRLEGVAQRIYRLCECRARLARVY
jgi:DNA recombination protein RmuC